MSYDGSIRIDTSLNPAGFNNGLKSMMGSLGKLTAAFGITIGLVAGFQFLKTGEQAARSLATALSGLGFVVQANGRDFKQANAFINEYISDGLVPATNAIEAYKNMVSRGYDDSQIRDMLNIMKDSAVYSRQAAFTIGESIEKTTQGLRMENSLLTDSVGIQKNVAQMWKEYAKSIGTTANNLTIAQKRQAEYNGFMAEGGVYAGAAAGYINTYAGKLSQLSAAFANLKVAVGNSVIPIINAVLPAINAAVNALTRLFNKIAIIMQVLFGYDVSANVAAYENSMSGVASSTQAAADAQEELARNTEKAGKAAKGALASFDKLDVLQQKDEGAGTNIGGIEIPSLGDATIALPAIDTSAADESLDAFREKVERIKASISKFFEPLKKPLADIGVAFGRVGEAIGRALAPLLTDPNFSAFVGAVRDGVVVVLELLAIVLNKIADWIDKNPEKFRAFASVLGFVAAAFLMITNPVALVIGIITLLLAAIGLLAKNWDKVKQAAVDTLETIKSTWNNANQWIYDNVTKPIGDKFFTLWVSVTNLAEVAWGNVKKIYHGIPQWFQSSVIDPIKNAFNAGINWIQEKWNAFGSGIKGIFKGVVYGVIDFLNGLLGKIEEGLNKAIIALNKIKIPEGIPVIGGIGINLGTVGSLKINYPRLATGAVIPPNAAFAAILGDQKSGRNIEAPESLIRQIVREETQGQNYTGPQAIDNRISINGREIYREMKRIENQQGSSLIKGAQPI